MRLIIDVNEVRNAFRRVRDRDNLERVREDLLDMGREEELLYVKDLLSKKPKKKNPNETISEQMRRIEDECDDQSKKSSTIYQFPNVYAVAKSMKSIEKVKISPIYDLFDQGDYMFVKDNKKFLIELCSTDEDLLTKAKAYRDGKSQIKNSQDKAELYGYEFRMVFLEVDRDEMPPEEFFQKFHKDDAQMIVDFKNGLKRDQVKVRSCSMPKELYETPNKDYFLNLEWNEELVRKKWRRVLSWFRKSIT